MKVIYLLEPEDVFSLPAIEPANLEPIREFDLIQAFTGHKNLTHAWNEFGLRLSVVQQVKKASAIPR